MTSITKKIIFLLFLLPFAALAEESEQTEQYNTQILDEPQLGYISDQIYVPLRGSPCPDCRIINKGLITGTKLNVLGYQDDWAMVSTQQGQEVD